MRCGPLLEIFPTGEPGGFRLVGELDGSAAGPLWSVLEPIASCGLGLTLAFDEVRFMDAAGVDVIVQAVAVYGNNVVIVTGVSPRVVDEFDRSIPREHPGLLIHPAA